MSRRFRRMRERLGAEGVAIPGAGWRSRAAPAPAHIVGTPPSPQSAASAGVPAHLTRTGATAGFCQACWKALPKMRVVRRCAAVRAIPVRSRASGRWPRARGRGGPAPRVLVAVKGRMNTTTAPHRRLARPPAAGPGRARVVLVGGAGRDSRGGVLRGERAAPCRRRTATSGAAADPIGWKPVNSDRRRRTRRRSSSPPSPRRRTTRSSRAPPPRHSSRQGRSAATAPRQSRSTRRDRCRPSRPAKARDARRDKADPPSPKPARVEPSDPFVAPAADVKPVLNDKVGRSSTPT